VPPAVPGPLVDVRVQRCSNIRAHKWWQGLTRLL
jgi:hypothetical protein